MVCCRGTRPSQAEKSRPRRKLSIGGAKACSASAVTGPTPGIVIRRAVSSFSRALVRSSRSSPLTFSSSSSIRPSSSRPSSTTASGRLQSLSSSAPASCRIPGPALRSHNAVLGQVTPKRVDRLRTLPHQQVTRVKEHRLRLLRF